MFIPWSGVDQNQCFLYKQNNMFSSGKKFIGSIVNLTYKS